jgi:hypothetical protein
MNHEKLDHILEKIQNNANNENQEQLKNLFINISIPNYEDERYISFLGWKFDIQSTIYYNARPNEVKLGYLSGSGFSFNNSNFSILFSSFFCYVKFYIFYF